jgi:hypothetical protein
MVADHQGRRHQGGVIDGFSEGVLRFIHSVENDR